MAKKIETDVIMTLSQDEWSAINTFLYEAQAKSAGTLAKELRESGIIIGQNHAEELVTMWDKIHLG